MENKEIIIDGINVSELTGEQLVCMNRYEIARLFAKLVDVLSETEDNYNNAQEDRVRMLANDTDLTDKLKRKEQECEELKRSITKIFACLIKANNRGKIIDTLWVDDITTLWDYIALTLGVEGDQTQIEKQILQKISEYKGEYNEKIR